MNTDRLECRKKIESHISLWFFMYQLHDKFGVSIQLRMRHNHLQVNTPMCMATVARLICFFFSSLTKIIVLLDKAEWSLNEKKKLIWSVEKYD